MKTIRKSLPLLLLILTLAGCGRKAATLDDFTRKVYSPTYATGFDITGTEEGASLLLTVTNPWQSADRVTTQLLLRGGEEPIPEGFTGQVLEGGEAHRIVCMSTTHVSMLSALDATDRIVGVSGADYISDPKLRMRIDSVGDVGYEGNINYELLITLDPDLVLLFGINGASSMEGKLKELGIPFVYIGDYVEESPLGKAEWLVALAELVGRRAEGEAVFDQIPIRYDALRSRVAEETTERPKVMLNTPYGDSWFMPSTGSFVAQLIRDAGGDYIYRKDTGNASMPIDLEEAYLLASEAEFWLDVGAAASLDDLRVACPKFIDTPPVVNGRVWNNNRRTNPAGGNDYYESAVVRPDVVLRDLVSILHPELEPEWEPVYYRRLE